ncbi:MAG: molybdopterin-dependent oxidoreductase [Chloroflexota bacterium]|nr:molybdopterin-dependent oxidoreductase [Chloroflexota bacterium]
MGITRRQFLKWSGVSAVGAVAFNGCLIPEQELQIESPVFLPEDLVNGIDNWYATLCRMDPEGCGIIIRVVEGRAKKVEGNPDYPINQGKHHARSEAGLQALYHPDRISEPLAREGDAHVPISWDEARRRIVDRMAGMSDRSKFLLVTQPLRGHQALLASEFVKAYGGRSMAYETLEQVTLRRSILEVFGLERLPVFDIQACKYLLSFGADFLSTWVSPVKYSRGYGELRQGSSRRGLHVQVDPRFSMTAANADEWVPVKPGGEGVLAMSMAYVIMRDGLGDQAAADALTGGGGHEALSAFSPDSQQVRDATGVEAGRIKELAHAFADPRNRPVMAIGGGSAGAHTSGLFNLRAIYSLNVLVGSVNTPGGIQFNPPPPLPELSTTDVMAMGVPASYREWKEMDRPQVLMIRGVNPVHGLPADANFRAAVEGAEFVVAFSSFMDETTAMADLVLPEHTYLEDWGDDVPDPGPGYQVIGFQQPVVSPFHAGTRGFADELMALGRALGLDLDSRLGLANVTDPTMEDLLKSGAEKLWEVDRGSVRASSFDGFWNGVLQRGGWWDTGTVDNSGIRNISPLDTAWPDISISDAPGGRAFNLVPFVSNSIGDGHLAHLPWLQATPDPITTIVWHTWVEMNTRTAEEMGLSKGDMVVVTAEGNRTVEAPVYPHPAVPPDTVSMPIGQGHTAFGQYAEGVGVNTLSLLAGLTDSSTGALAWAATRVRVVKSNLSIDIPRFEGNQFAEEADEQAIIKITKPE